MPKCSKPRYPLVIWVSGSGPSYKTVKSKETIKTINCFLDKGYAYFRIDKPGCCESKGRTNDDSLFSQLPGIVVDAVKNLKLNSMIDSNKIGLFGSSQADYIMPYAISKCNDISFMLGASCPGENSIEQWNYLLERQMLCEGISIEKASKNIQMFSLLRSTPNKNLFDEALEYFTYNPLIIPSLNYDSSFISKARSWWPRKIDYADESHLNPILFFDKIKLPLFLVYGEKDTQIDPVQAIEEYTRVIQKMGNPKSQITLLKNSDHNMSLSGGCLSEIYGLNKSGTYKLDPDYLLLISRWLDELSVMN